MKCQNVRENREEKVWTATVKCGDIFTMLAWASGCQDLLFPSVIYRRMSLLIIYFSNSILGNDPTDITWKSSS